MLKRFRRDDDAASMVEFSLIVSVFLFLTLGAVDFTLAFYQWTSVTKAVQLGARLAAVSNPVCGEVSNWTGLTGGSPGDPPPAYEWVYSAGACSCSGAGCTAGTADTLAIQRLLCGRDGVCGGTGFSDSSSFPGMLDVLPPHLQAQLGPNNIIVRYTGTGLGYIARPSGPVPTITVEVTGLTFNFMLLNGLLGLGPITMPRLHTTVTGEDLAFAGT